MKTYKSVHHKFGRMKFFLTSIRDIGSSNIKIPSSFKDNSIDLNNDNISGI